MYLQGTPSSFSSCRSPSLKQFRLDRLDFAMLLRLLRDFDTEFKVDDESDDSIDWKEDSA